MDVFIRAKHIKIVFVSMLIFFLSCTSVAALELPVSRSEQLRFVCNESAWPCPENANKNVSFLPLTLSYSGALRSALRDSTEAQLDRLNKMLQQAQWETAQAGYIPKWKFGGDAQKLGASSSSAAIFTNKISAGLDWNLPISTGTQIKAKIEKNLTEDRNPSWVFELVQPLFRDSGAVAKFPLKVSEISVRINELERDKILNNLYASVSVAYIQSVADRKQFRLAQVALDRVHKSRDVNLALFELGRIAKLELLQSEADIAQAEHNLASARNDALASVSNLLQYLGGEWAERQPEDVVLDEIFPMAASAVLPQTDEQVIVHTQNTRDDILLAKDAIELARIGLAQAKNDALPKVDLILSHAIQSSSLTDKGNHSRFMALSWEIPLDRSLLRLQKTQAEVNVQSAELAFNTALRQVRSEVVAAIRTLAFSKDQLAMASKILEINRLKFDAENERLRLGKISSFQLSAAQNELSNAENMQTQAGQNMLRSVIEYERVTGALKARRMSVLAE